jgi:hypothetical protein
MAMAEPHGWRGGSGVSRSRGKCNVKALVTEVAEALDMTFREGMAGFLKRLVRARKSIDVVADQDSVKLVVNGQTVFPAFRWGEVTEIRVFKRDLGILDDIRLACQVRGDGTNSARSRQALGNSGKRCAKSSRGSRRTDSQR